MAGWLCGWLDKAVVGGVNRRSRVEVEVEAEGVEVAGGSSPVRLSQSGEGGRQVGGCWARNLRPLRTRCLAGKRWIVSRQKRRQGGGGAVKKAHKRGGQPQKGGVDAKGADRARARMGNGRPSTPCEWMALLVPLEMPAAEAKALETVMVLAALADGRRITACADVDFRARWAQTRRPFHTVPDKRFAPTRDYVAELQTYTTVPGWQKGRVRFA